MSDKEKNGTELAEDRTEWAEDRTVLANERTFAGWLRTGLGSVGIGLAFQAVFSAAEPTWLAKSAASVFIAIGVLIFFAAKQNSKRMLERLNAHTAEPVSPSRLDSIAWLLIVGAALTLVVLWLI